MSDIPLPSALTEEAVAMWLFHLDYPRQAWEEADAGHLDTYLTCARAVLSLLLAKVREAVELDREESHIYGKGGPDPWIDRECIDRIVARVMGENGGRRG